MEFAYYFHYSKNLKFEDRPDYSMLKSLFYDLLMSKVPFGNLNHEFTFDWFEDFKETKKGDEADQNKDFNNIYATPGNANNVQTANTTTFDATSPSKGRKHNFNLDNNMVFDEANNKNNVNLINLEEGSPNTKRNSNRKNEIQNNNNNINNNNQVGDLINFKDITSNFDSNKLPKKNDMVNETNPDQEKRDSISFNRQEFLSRHVNSLKNNNGNTLINNLQNNFNNKQIIHLKSINNDIDSNTSFSKNGSSDSDTEKMDKDKALSNDAEVKKIIKCKIILFKFQLELNL